MSLTRWAAAVVGAAAIAGCGAAVPAALQPDPRLDEVARDCGLDTTRVEASDGAAELVPPVAGLVRSRDTGRGHRADAVIARSPTAGIALFRRHAESLGYAVAMSENEGFEADIVLQGGRGTAVVKLYESAKCAEASRVIVTHLP